MRGAVHCCKCGQTFPTKKWAAAGVLMCRVNEGKKHYACKPCRDAGFDVIKHAAMLTGPCAAAKKQVAV